MDSGFQVLDSSHWNLDSGFLPVSGIPDSLSCISDSKAQDSRFHKQNFPEFRKLDSRTLGEKSEFVPRN